MYYSTYGTPVLKSRLYLQSKPSTEYSCNSSQKIQAFLSDITNGLSFAREDIEAYKIQIPTSMTLLQNIHMTSPMSSHFQPNVSDEYSTEEFSHPTALNYCQRPSLFSTVMRVASLQIQTRFLSTIVFSVQIASQRFSPSIPFEISHDSILQIASQRFLPSIPFEISHDSNLMYQAYFSQRISVHLELNCTQNLYVMALELPTQQYLLLVEPENS